MQITVSKPRKMAMLAGTWIVMSLTAPAFAVDILDDPVQIDERVTQLIQTSNSLCWEMYRYHQQQPDYRDSYQSAKDLWSQATRLRDALRVNPVETVALNQQVTEMTDTFAKIEKSLTKWGTGDQSSVAASSNQTVRTVVTPGVGLNIPFLSLQVGGGSQVEVIDDGQPQLQRLRLHPNAHGSKRSLERGLAAVKLALSYLVEDSGMAIPTGLSAVSEATPTGQSPQPPRPDSTLDEPATVVPARKQDIPTDRK